MNEPRSRVVGAGPRIELADPRGAEHIPARRPPPRLTMSTAPSPKDWLILQCHACGSPMKVRAETAPGARISCPVCRSPVVPQGGGEPRSPEFKAELSQQPERHKSEPTRRRPAEDGQTDAEFTPTLGTRPASLEGRVSPLPYDDSFLQNLKHTDEHQSGRQIRVRKRRKQGAGSKTVQRDAGKGQLGRLAQLETAA